MAIDQQERLDEVWDRLVVPFVDAMRAEGLTMQVIVGYFDPFTEISSLRQLGCGDWYARLGYAKEFLDGNVALNTAYEMRDDA